jgi:hypothetical protein
MYAVPNAKYLKAASEEDGVGTDLPFFVRKSPPFSETRKATYIFLSDFYLDPDCSNLTMDHAVNILLPGGCSGPESPGF